jgi:hypothetical protein
LTAEGHPLAYFRYAGVSVRELYHTLDMEEFRTFNLVWMEDQLAMTLAASGGLQSPSPPSSQWKSIVVVHDMKDIEFSKIFHLPGLMALNKARVRVRVRVPSSGACAAQQGALAG